MRFYTIDEEQLDAIEQLIEDLLMMHSETAIDLDEWPEACHFIDVMKGTRRTGA